MKNLIGRADSKNQPANFTWDEVNKFMANMGQGEFTYDTFKQAYDTDPAIKAITHRFDQNGVELKSKVSGSTTAPSDLDKSKEKIHKTAVKAARRHMD